MRRPPVAKARRHRLPLSIWRRGPVDSRKNHGGCGRFRGAHRRRPALHGAAKAQRSHQNHAVDGTVGTPLSRGFHAVSDVGRVSRLCRRYLQADQIDDVAIAAVLAELSWGSECGPNRKTVKRSKVSAFRGCLGPFHCILILCCFRVLPLVIDEDLQRVPQPYDVIRAEPLAEQAHSIQAGACQQAEGGERAAPTACGRGPIGRSRS